MAFHSFSSKPLTVGAALLTLDYAVEDLSLVLSDLSFCLHFTILFLSFSWLQILLYKQSSFNHYERIGTGVLSINFTNNGGETGVLSYVNSTFLQLMGLPKNDELEITDEVDPQRDLIFHRTEELFEPLPKNREWNTLKERRTHNGSVMTLSMHGHERKCIVFSEPAY